MCRRRVCRNPQHNIDGICHLAANAARHATVLIPIRRAASKASNTFFELPLVELPTNDVARLAERLNLCRAKTGIKSEIVFHGLSETTYPCVRRHCRECPTIECLRQNAR